MSTENGISSSKPRLRLDHIEPIARILKEGCSYEAILTTRSKETFNFSAVGVKRHGEHLALNIFEGSDSYINMRKHRTFGLSFLSSGELDSLFTASVEGWHKEDSQEFGNEDLEFFCDIPYIKKGLIYLFCQATEIAQGTMHDAVGKSSYLALKGEVLDWKLKEGERDAQAFSRGPALFVEALVHFTKLKAFLDKQKTERSDAIPGEMIFRFNALKYQLRTLGTLGWEREYEVHCATLKKTVKQWEKIFLP